MSLFQNAITVSRGERSVSSFPLLSAKGTKGKFTLTVEAIEIIFGKEAARSFINAQNTYNAASKETDAERAEAATERDKNSLYVSMIFLPTNIETDIEDGNGNVLPASETGNRFYIHGTADTSLGAKLGNYSGSSVDFSHSKLWSMIKTEWTKSEGIAGKAAVEQEWLSYNHLFTVTEFGIEAPHPATGEKTMFYAIEMENKEEKSSRKGSEEAIADAPNTVEDSSSFDDEEDDLM